MIRIAKLVLVSYLLNTTIVWAQSRLINASDVIGALGYTPASLPLPTLQAINVSLNPYTPGTAIPGNQPFQVQETVTGTCTTITSPCYYNFVNIAADNAVVGSGTSGTFTSATANYFNQNIGGATMTGNRAVGTFNLLMNQTTGNTVGGVSYSALTALGQATANDNGTGTGSTTSRGQIETINFLAHLGPSATNWNNVQGGEVDIKLESGSSTFSKIGWQITQLGGDAVQGATWDAAEVINSANTAPGWKVGLLFGGAQGFSPLTSTSTAILSDSTVTTVGSVLDFSSATINANFLNSKNFSVTGAGVVTSGLNGTAGGQVRLRGSTSGGATLSVGSTGALQLANGTGGQNVLFNDGGNGTMFTINGAGGAIAGQISITAATTGVAPQIAAIGTDTNINLNLVPKGAGVLAVSGTSGVTCSGAPTASFATVGGLVTHC